MSMQDDLQIMKTEAEKQDNYINSIGEQAAEIPGRQSKAAFDFDRALIFIRTIDVRVRAIFTKEK